MRNIGLQARIKSSIAAWRWRLENGRIPGISEVPAGIVSRLPIDDIDMHTVSSGEVASTGTVMIAVLPIILGVQFLLNFLSFDMANEPRVPIQPTFSLADIVPHEAGA